jgi:2'-5' RNA ligase
MTRPLIVTATLDPTSFAKLDALRQEHFPPERNFLAAHLTLFHHLPGEKAVEIADFLESLSAGTAPIELQFSEWFSLGRGVAIRVDSTELARVRHRIAERFEDDLTPQDRQKWRAHVTVQNKVSPDDAKALLVSLSAKIPAFMGTATGLSLWRYLGGPWGLEREFGFIA